MAFFITGDTHGDFRRFLPERFYEQETLTKEDFVTVCGDLGGVWYGDHRDDEGLDFLERGPLPPSSLRGTMKTMMPCGHTHWRTGTAGRSAAFGPRCSCWSAGKCLTWAENGSSPWAEPAATMSRTASWSRDDPQFLQKLQRLNARGAAFRIDHRSWWKEELPSPEEYQEARRNLERTGWEVDYIITHCAPTSIQNELLQTLSRPDELTDFLEEVRQRCRFQYHFFGHYHGDLVIRQKYVLLYEQILRLK